MQTLGLSESTPRSEGRLKALLWPTIHNDTDLEYVTEQGFWICAIVSAVSLWGLLKINSLPIQIVGFLEVLFFFLGGIGVRQRSKFAAIAVLVAYSAGYALRVAAVGASMVNQVATQSMGGIVGIVIIALLLANVRGVWQAAAWQRPADEPPPIRLAETFKDKFVDRMPEIVWPKARIVFNILAGLEFVLIALALVGTVLRART
jgi:hypothetical protein